VCLCCTKLFHLHSDWTCLWLFYFSSAVIFQFGCHFSVELIKDSYKFNQALQLRRICLDVITLLQKYLDTNFHIVSFRLKGKELLNCLFSIVNYKCTKIVCSLKDKFMNFRVWRRKDEENRRDNTQDIRKLAPKIYIYSSLIIIIIDFLLDF